MIANYFLPRVEHQCLLRISIKVREIIRTKMTDATIVFVKIAFLVSLICHCSSCANITQAEELYSTLFTNYNRHMLPVLDLNDTIVVRSYVAVVGINKFDEINGEIDITCAFNMLWVDERLKWTPSDYGGKTSLIISKELIWYPMLYLLQSFERIQVIGNTSHMLRLYYNGTIVWTPPNVLKVICSVDVTYFPFDKQTCSMSVSTWLYTKAEMKFVISQTSLDLDLLSANSQWDISSGVVANASNSLSPYDSIEVQIRLHRKSDFYVVYLICPLIFLGCINSLVFVMPASSGERTSVAITVFLSFVVFMEMVNSNVPESSSPLAYIYYYMLFLLIYSTVVLCTCVISLRIYDKDEAVSTRVVKLVKCLMFWRIKCRKQRVSQAEESVDKIENDDTDKMEFYNTDVVLEDTTNITWKVVGKTFDKYCCGILFLVYVINTLVTFSRLYGNIGL